MESNRQVEQLGPPSGVIRKAAQDRKYPRLDHNYRQDMRAGYYLQPFVPTHYRKIDGMRARLIPSGDSVESIYHLVELESPRRTTLISADRLSNEWSSVQ